jgi:A/G-specific adenine glycosylase
MAALPGPEWGDERPSQPVAATISRGFTHFTLDLHIAFRSEPSGEGWWQPLSRLNEAGLPTLYAKAVAAMLSRKESLAA